jgi:hypothetical protein
MKNEKWECIQFKKYSIFVMLLLKTRSPFYKSSENNTFVHT